MKKSNYHILFFPHISTLDKQEDVHYSKGKTYSNVTLTEAYNKFLEEYPGATFLSMYDVEEMAKIKP